MTIYIQAASSISPQKTFRRTGFLDDVLVYNQNRLKAIEPDYKEFVDPRLIRRMSRIIRMGVSAAGDCLQQANIKMPGAIVTGTALGCQEDTLQFLSRIIEQQEEVLPPTAFIQSTHNTVAAQIALMLKCHSYNNTFVHKGISFESALTDAAMLLNEEDADNVLVGGIEEMTDTAFTILTRLGLYKRWPVSNLDLLNTQSKGTIGGEGATFILLSAKSDNAIAIFKGVKTFYKPSGEQAINERIIGYLEEKGLSFNDIDLLITGKNGDLKNDAVYQPVTAALPDHAAVANYKHLCGEYATSTSFALWLAANILKMGNVPHVVRERGDQKKQLKNILIYNHYQNTYHSLMLVSAVE